MITCKVPVKSHIHTNPDGSTIKINALDIDEREVFMDDQWKKVKELSNEDKERLKQFFVKEHK